MSKIVFPILLVVVSGGAAAEWTEIGANQAGTVYADSATIRQAEGMTRMWDLADFKAVQARPYGTPYLSQKTQQEYDCNERRARIVELLRYSDNMGKGEIASSESEPGKWEPVATGTVSEALFGMACGTR